jgi:hypothetical protein
MQKIATTLLAAIGAFGALAATPFTVQDAQAHQPRARVGVYIGAPLVFSPWPYYYRPYYDPYYYPRTVVIREQPVVYTEQSAPVVPMAPPPPAPQAQAQQQYWYFCQDTQTYYPHVQNCATPWQRVIPHAPR